MSTYVGDVPTAAHVTPASVIRANLAEAPVMTVSEERLRLAITRSLHANYARERLRDGIAAVVEDALVAISAARRASEGWSGFEDELRQVVEEVAASGHALRVEHLTELRLQAPPRVTERLESSPAWIEHG
jgi:hypothetical protein